MSGRTEIYVGSYPALGASTLVSEGGGTNPAWRKDGRELYYTQGAKIVAASLEWSDRSQPPVVRGRTTLFEMPQMNGTRFDASPDGQRFAIVRGGPRVGRLVVALDIVAQPASAVRLARP